MNEQPAAAAPQVIASPIPGTILKSMKFHFKKDDLGNKRPTVELAIPVPTVDGIATMLADEKQTAFLLEVLADQDHRGMGGELDMDADDVVAGHGDRRLARYLNDRRIVGHQPVHRLTVDRDLKQLYVTITDSTADKNFRIMGIIITYRKQMLDH